VTLDLKLAAGQTDNDDQKSQPEEKKEESDQNPVMNFFKTLVSATYQINNHGCKGYIVRTCI
jgi:hypothetical protein